METLIYHHGALGDFITTFPLLSYLRSNSDSKICLLSKTSHGQLAEAAGLIDNYIDVNSRTFLCLFMEKLTKQTEMFLKRFNRFIIFANHDSPLIEHIRQIHNVQVYIQPPFHKSKIHTAHYHMSLLKEHGCSIEDYKLHFSIPKNIQESADTLVYNKDKTVIIAPGSGSPIKNWPIEKYKELSFHLKEKYFKVIWVAGPAENHFTLPENETVVRTPDLLSLVAFFLNSKYYVGNDSGVTHLAGISGCNVIALFGPSDPVVWKPLGNSVNVIYKSQSCSPCHLKNVTRNCDLECMRKIEVEDVLKYII